METLKMTVWTLGRTPMLYRWCVRFVQKLWNPHPVKCFTAKSSCNIVITMKIQTVSRISYILHPRDHVSVCLLKFSVFYNNYVESRLRNKTAYNFN